ncbi:MAG TPA: hypothetical protein VGT41_00705 [Candidatus Babeliales bacterium]|nr:hypothetical protein [Candidatus Babeliales bacterium]
MKIARLKLSDGSYFPAEQSKDNFWILAGFLTDDVSWYETSSYREFINNPHEIETGGNYIMLEKEGNDVLLACQYDDDFEPYIKMSQQEFLSILDQWEALVKLRPAEIIIFKKNDSYILEGRNAPSQE